MTPSAMRERPGRHRLQLAGRWLMLVAAVALAWPLRQDSATAVLLPALSPFVAVAAAVSVRAAGVLTLLALPVLLLGLIFPRWFCRHGCPVGLLQEILENLLANKVCAPRDHEPWRQPSLAASAPGFPAGGQDAALTGRLEARLHERRFMGSRSRLRLKWPTLGPGLVLLTLGGALVGYPWFLWLDPLAIFNGFLNAWRQPIAIATLLTGLGLPLLLLLDWAAPRLWCQRICPLGATQDLLAWPRRRLRIPSRCPAPDRVDGVTESHRGRRWFLAAVAGTAGAWALKAVGGRASPPLRPPGSRNEPRFTGLCVRCGNCAQVCPSGIIQPDFGAGGVTGFLTPRLRFDRDYCRENCHRCNEVCPSGALARLSLADKQRHVIGRAVVDLDLCLLAQGGECTACIRHCPYQALALQSADGGFSNQPGVIPDRCNGCGACEAVCPTRPRRAIRVQAPQGIHR